MLTLALVGSTATVAVSAADDTANPYEVQAAKYDEQAYYEDDLGATYTPEKTTFKVWSPSASKIVLNLFETGSDDEEGAAKLDVY